MITEVLLEFLRCVKVNNNTQRLHAHKDLYQRERGQFLDFCQYCIDQIQKKYPDRKDVNLKECVFRFNKDIRFSKDKSPYKTHFAAILWPHGKKWLHSWLYIHIEPDNKSFIWGGAYMPSASDAKKIRQALVDHFNEFHTIVNNKHFTTLFTLSPCDHLVKKPTWIPDGHPATERAMKKSRTRTHPISDKELLDDRIADNIVSRYDTYAPLDNFISRIFYA